ncbi:MAG: Mpo1-like protein [Vulcanococcus sp.]
MLAGRPWSAWIEEYGRSHTHPWNQLLHLLGIPLIVLSLPLALATVVVSWLGPLALVLFLLGWVLQLIGHGIERRPPEFFRDPRFLLVGLRWWVAKVGALLQRSSPRGAGWS